MESTPSTHALGFFWGESESAVGPARPGGYRIKRQADHGVHPVKTRFAPGGRMSFRGATRLVIACVLLGFATLSGAQEVLVEFGSSMTYLPVSSDPGLGLSWTAEAFDDSGWTVGTYGVGYETNPGGAQNLIQTTVSTSARTIYTRATFTLADASSVDSLFLGADYDDGYVVWINGTEVARSASMPTGGPFWNSVPTEHESSNAASPNYEIIDITSSIPLLHNGVNVLSVGIWNIGVGSSDLVVVPMLMTNQDVSLSRRPYLQLRNARQRGRALADQHSDRASAR